MTRQHSVTMSQEIEEMEMMDRQFNAMGGGRGGQAMFSRRMDTMDRFSNPWDSDVMDDNGMMNNPMMRGGRGGGMRGGRGMGRGGFGSGGMGRNIDPSVGMDMDYMAYNDGGFSRGGGFGGTGGFGNRGGGFGNQGGGFGSQRDSRAPGFGKGGFGNKVGGSRGGGVDLRQKETSGGNSSINPDFDSLYEPEFGAESAFEKARAKLNSNNRGGFSRGFGGARGGSRGATRGGGPPTKTWSN